MNEPFATGEHNRIVPRIKTLEMYYQSIKNYSYLVVDEARHVAAIIDPAWEMEKVDLALADDRARLGGILITHSHPDHIHLAKPLAEKYNCPIWMSKEEIAASGFYATQLVEIENAPWRIGELLIEPISTPGHTAGSTCYLIGDNLFTGDVLFAEGCGICADLESAHQMFASLEKLKMRLDGQTRVFPGHSYGQPPGQRLWKLVKNNIYLQFPDKESFASFRLRSGQDRAKMFSFC